jgi:hypothetical protein
MAFLAGPGSSAVVGQVLQPIRRFGDRVLDRPPEAAPVTALNPAPGALFPGGRFDPHPG